MRFLLSRLLWATKLSRFLKIQKEGYQLRFFPSSVSALYWTDPDAGSFDETFIRHCLRQGDTFVDVGANVGALTVVGALAVGQRGRVYAVEPHPRIHSYLVGNIRLNGLTNVTAYRYALGDGAATTGFEDRHADDMNSIVRGGVGSVQLIRLDDLDTGIGDVALLKVDVEGYEKFVLEGGVVTLRRCKTVFIECYDVHFARYGYHTGDVLSLLRKGGFVCLRPVSGHSFVRLPTAYRSARCENLVAVRDLSDFISRTGWNVMT